MKKFFVVLIAVISGSNLFALENWKTNFDIGISFPIFSTTFEATNDIDIDGKGNGVDFSILEQLIHKESGFLFEVGLNIGGLKIKDFYEDEDEWGFNFDGHLGLGYAFKHDEKAIITMSALLGYDWSIFSKDISVSHYGYSYDMTAEATAFIFYLGANLATTIRLNEKAGLFGSFLVGLPVAGVEAMKVSYQSISKSETYDLHAGGYFVRPAFGLSITID